MNELKDKVIDLNQTRKRELIWLGQSKLDVKLLFECAYYPRPPAFGQTRSGCCECSFDQPRKNCKYAHILDFSEQTKPKIKFRRRKNREEDELGQMLLSLSQEDLARVMEYVRARKGVKT